MLKRVHLRQFLALAECGSFTAAADRLRVTQPTLSAGIAELERSAGCSLLIRERRAIRLTEAGNRLLAHARTIEREFALAEAALSDSPSNSPPLRLGVLASLRTEAIAAIAACHVRQRPLQITEGSDADLRRRLADNRLDLALTLLRAHETEGLVSEEPYAMILPGTHRLAGRKQLEPEELAGETMIARRSCEILAETSRFFTARGVRPHFVFRSSNDDRCLALVRSGAGITTAPVSLAVEGTVAIPLRGYDFVRRVGLVAAHGMPEPADIVAVTEALAATGSAPTM